MPGFSNIEGILGNQQINFIGTVDSTQRQAPGLILAGVDPYWGGGEFMYVQANGNIRAFGLVSISPVYDSTTGQIQYMATEAASTANLGRTLGVSLASMVAGNFGWVQIGGLVPVNCTATVAVGVTVSVVATGQGGAAAAGKQILNAVSAIAASNTVVKAGATGNNGSKQINVSNSDGLFVGAYLSGTGVGAACILNSISPDGKTLTVSVANSAAVTGNLTATYNNGTIFYNVLHINRPFQQGAIT